MLDDVGGKDAVGGYDGSDGEAALAGWPGKSVFEPLRKNDIVLKFCSGYSTSTTESRAARKTERKPTTTKATRAL